MKGSSGWWLSTTVVAVALCALAAFTSCTGKGDTPTPAQSSAGGDSPPAVSRTITEDEVATLPKWQRDLLADPGWDQPAIPQVVETPMPAPSQERLEAASKQASVALQTSANRSASYIGWWPNGCDHLQGEFNGSCPPNGLPWACTHCDGDTLFDTKIEAALVPEDTPFVISWVEKGISNSNHFNTTGGSSSNALCATYQLYCSECNGNPTLPYSSYQDPPKFSEAAYRSDGGPEANGDPCNAPQAYIVRDFIWWKYNQQNFNALPGLNTTALYNILIAPSSDLSTADSSSGDTSARYQSFYMGSLNSAVYGGAQIVSIEASESSCEVFRNSIGNNRLFYTNPIYGVLLKRWQDSVLKSMPAPDNNPWDGELGWPVQGPIAYNNGASTLTGKGAYYAWGMYFERGFVWWIDYINNTNVPDEAQAYHYTGDNVFCKSAGDIYEKLPTIYYGGTGPLGVCVIIEASLNPDHGPGSPSAGTFYEVSAPPPPSPALLLDMHAHGFGGTPRASDAHYKHYTWAFRDGTIGLTNGVPYDDSTKYVQHGYPQAANYTVRVQVVDANGAVAYGDSLPIHVNWIGGGGG